MKFNSFCKLPKLEKLDISWIYGITGSGLENFHNLRELYCQGCENLEEKNVINLLKYASNLERLNIRFCDKITNRLILTAIEETRKRTNYIVLVILTFGTNINQSKIKEKSRFLRLM